MEARHSTVLLPEWLQLSQFAGRTGKALADTKGDTYTVYGKLTEEEGASWTLMAWVRPLAFCNHECHGIWAWCNRLGDSLW